MRIGILTGEYPPMHGGVGACSRMLGHALCARGHKVRIFSAAQAQDEELPLRRHAGGWGPRSLLALRQWATASRLDVLNLQFQTAAFGMSPWMHFLPHVLGRVPVVTTLHDLRAPWLFPKAGPLRPAILRHLARSSAAVIVTNVEDEIRLGRHLPCARVPVGSNILAGRPSDFSAPAWRAQHGISGGEFLLAWFGLTNHSKGLTTLLKALAALRAEGLSIRLVLIGGEPGASDPGDRACHTQLLHMIRELALKPAIIHTGYLRDEEVAAWLWACDTLALPYRDGASLRRGSLMAGLQHGCAILSTRPRVVVAEFAHGRNLWLVPPDDAAALADGIRFLRADPALRWRLRQGARALATRFDWDAIAAACEEIFRRVLPASPAQQPSRALH